MRKSPKIKFLSKTPVDALESLWSSILPTDEAFQRAFTFDPDDRDYDFLVIYEDLPPLSGERKIFRREVLSCPPNRTLHISPEPSSIRLEGLHYLAQFGAIWTSRKFSDRERQFLQRKDTWICDKPLPLRWFYGRDMEGDEHWNLKQIEQSPIKTKNLSTITSNKAMKHTVHKDRLDFLKDMKLRIGEDMALFGRGINPIRNKAEAMDCYQYHIAIENHIQPGHYTEKITDCFLAECLCFYFGDPNYSKIFPKESVIPIDIYDAEKSEKIIRKAISENAYSKHLPYILEAKKIALKLTNPLRASRQLAVDIISNESDLKPQIEGNVIEGRHLFRRNNKWAATRDAASNIRMRRHSLNSPLQF